MDPSVAHIIHILRDRVDTLVEQEDYAEAIHAATAAVEKASQALSSDLDSIDEFVSVLEIRAELFRFLNRFEEARNDFKEALDQLDNRPDRNLQIARMTASLGAVHDSLGNTERAAELWQEALSLFEANEPPMLVDVAIMANNLAYLKKANGDFEAAEGFFLRALEICHQELGNDHEQTAVISNNLGALYHSAGHFEQAREMHLMALEVRKKGLGNEHPDTAQSYNNLALALVETDDRARARLHFEDALEIFEQLGPEFQSDLEAVIENFCAFLRDQGEVNAAKALEKRLELVS
jgi:tetratricopeptide (TPR) repeat protein